MKTSKHPQPYKSKEPDERIIEALAIPEKLGITLDAGLQKEYEYALFDFMWSKDLSNPRGSKLARTIINKGRQEFLNLLGETKEGGRYPYRSLKVFIMRMEVIFRQVTSEDPIPKHKSVLVVNYPMRLHEGYQETNSGKFLDLIHDCITALGYPPENKTALGHFIGRLLKPVR